MKYHNKSILLFVMIFMLIAMSTGCNSINSIVPNPTVNPDNSTVSYVVVTASSSTIKVDQSIQLVVKGYNSDDEWVILDKSKIKLWKWSIIGQCWDCIKEYVNLSPKSASLTTTFSSGKAGTFYVVAYYQEESGADYITDYTGVTVK